MRHAPKPLAVVFLLALVMWAAWPSAESEAQFATGSASAFTECAAFNWTFDSGLPPIECGTGYTGIRLDMIDNDGGAPRSTQHAYICGETGCTQANFRRAGTHLCSTCAQGTRFDIGGARKTVRCVSGVADASAYFSAHCVK